jgi:creatinine amidohydrolase
MTKGNNFKEENVVTDKILYEELCPAEFTERLNACPVAYLPLGTLEWHGPHLPLGADIIQPTELFKMLAKEIGGIVMPPLFLGPDIVTHGDDIDYYGMDNYLEWTVEKYETQQMVGSAYWVPDELYRSMLLAIASNISRAGFRILVAHGHGPAVNMFRSLAQEVRVKYKLECISPWDFSKEENLMFQSDHAAHNETSIILACRPELVQMERIEKGGEKLIGIGSVNPIGNASAELGRNIFKANIADMKNCILKKLSNTR